MKWCERKKNGWLFTDDNGYQWEIDAVEITPEGTRITYRSEPIGRDPNWESKVMVQETVPTSSSRALVFPSNRVNATMARGSGHLQTKHTVDHLTWYGVPRSEATTLLSGLTWAQIDDVHDCMHSNSSIKRACVKALRQYRSSIYGKRSTGVVVLEPGTEPVTHTPLTIPSNFLQGGT